MVNSKSQACCTCLPYNDGLMITAQILSILAIFLSWANGITLILGVVSFFCLQIVWCCRMGKCGLITTGVFCTISGCCSIIVGVLILAAGGTTSTLCEQFESGQYSGNVEIDTDDPNFQQHCTVGLNIYLSVAFVGGALWLVIAFLLLTFSCGRRYEAYIVSVRERTDKDVVVTVQQSQQQEQHEPNKTAIAVTGFEEP